MGLRHGFIVHKIEDKYSMIDSPNAGVLKTNSGSFWGAVYLLFIRQSIFVALCCVKHSVLTMEIVF